MENIQVLVPVELKRKLEALRLQGYTASGFIRALLDREFAEVPEARRLEPRTRLKRTTVARR